MFPRKLLKQTALKPIIIHYVPVGPIAYTNIMVIYSKILLNDHDQTKFHEVYDHCCTLLYFHGLLGYIN